MRPPSLVCHLGGHGCDLEEKRKRSKGKGKEASFVNACQ